MSPTIFNFDIGIVDPIPILPLERDVKTVPPIPTSIPRFTLKFWSAKVHYPLFFKYL
jgi:hypothetical protein